MTEASCLLGEVGVLSDGVSQGEFEEWPDDFALSLKRGAWPVGYGRWERDGLPARSVPETEFSSGVVENSPSA